MNATKKPTLLLLTALVATLASAPVSAAGLDSFRYLRGKQYKRERPNLVEVLVKKNERRGQFDTLIAAVTAVSEASENDPSLPDLLDILSSDGPLTLFAPTDKAFGKLPVGTVETLLMPENLGTLADILLYHATPGKKTVRKLLRERDITMANGDPAVVEFSYWPPGVFINDAKIVNANNRASNGILHAIGNVLLPPPDAPALQLASSFSAASVPEPSSVGLAGLALVSVCLIGYQRQNLASARV